MVKSRRSTSCAGIGLEVHAIRPAAVAVMIVAAEGGDFHLRGLLAHQHHAEMRAHLLGPVEQLGHDVGARIGGNVEVFRMPAEQQIAHASAHQLRLVAGRAQAPHDIMGEPFRSHSMSLLSC